MRTTSRPYKGISDDYADKAEAYQITYLAAKPITNSITG